MRLFTFETDGLQRLGVEVKGQLVDLQFGSKQHISRNGPFEGSAQPLPGDMLSLIRGGGRTFRLAQQAAELGARRMALPVGERLLYTFDEARLLQPLLRPGKILCQKADGALVIKLPSTAIGCGGRIVAPPGDSVLAVSPTLAAVVGKRARNLERGSVESHIFGLTILLNISCPSIEDPQLAANADTFCSFGPCILTVEEWAGLESISLIARRNGAAALEAPASALLPQLLNALLKFSRSMTLEPGDLVSAEADGQASLSIQRGDSIAVDFGALGVLENIVE